MIQKQEAVKLFSNQLSLYEKNVLAKLLEQHNITPDKFVQVVLTEVKKNDKLIQALIENPASMYASILSGAEIGLMPSEMIGEFYLIPRNMKQDNGTYKMTVCCQIGYKGLVSILLRSGDITRIHTEVVYEGDEFEAIYGLEPTINHKPNFNAIRTADRIKYAYAVAKNKNGEYQFAVMTRKEIEVIRDMPKYKNDLYFNDDKGNNRWMERKAALIQLSKMLPKDYYAKKAISMDSQLESGALLTLDEDNKVKVISPNPVRQKNKVYGTLLNIEDDTKS